MRLVVFGANGPTGRQVVRQGLAAGHEMAAVTRKPDEYPIESPDLRVVTADVMEPGQVAQALSGSDAVISTYGVPYTRKKITVYSTGISNIIHGMNDQGITRLVCVSSTSVSTEEAPGESFFWREALIPVLRNVVGRTLYDDMQLMEEVVRRTNLDWTIVRPGGLFNTAHPTGDYEVAERRLSGRMTSRADLAEELLLKATTQQHPRTTIEVITRSQLPGIRTFLKGAFGT